MNIRMIQEHIQAPHKGKERNKKSNTQAAGSLSFHLKCIRGGKKEEVKRGRNRDREGERERNRDRERAREREREGEVEKRSFCAQHSITAVQAVIMAVDCSVAS